MHDAHFLANGRVFLEKEINVDFNVAGGDAPRHAAHDLWIHWTVHKVLETDWNATLCCYFDLTFSALPIVSVSAPSLSSARICACMPSALSECLSLDTKTIPLSRTVSLTDLVKRRQALDAGAEVTSSQQEIDRLLELDVLLLVLAHIKLGRREKRNCQPDRDRDSGEGDREKRGRGKESKRLSP